MTLVGDLHIHKTSSEEKRLFQEGLPRRRSFSIYKSANRKNSQHKKGGREGARARFLKKFLF